MPLKVVRHFSLYQVRNSMIKKWVQINLPNYELQESQAGYKFLLDVGTQELGGIGTIIIEIRKVQMDEFCKSVKSSYKLVTKDWSGLLKPLGR